MNISDRIRLTHTQLTALRAGKAVACKNGTNIMGQPIYTLVRPPKKEKP